MKIRGTYTHFRKELVGQAISGNVYYMHTAFCFLYLVLGRSDAF